MFAEDKEIVVEVRLARRELKGRNAASQRENVDGKGAVFARNDFVFVVHVSVIGQAIQSHTGTQGDAKLSSAEEGLFAATFRDKENIGGLQQNVFALKFGDFLEVQSNFLLLALTVSADDDGVIGFCGAAQATGEGKDLESAHLATIIGENKTTRATDRTEDVNDAGVRNSNDIAGLQGNVVGGVAVFDEFVEIDGDGIGGVRGSGCGRGSGGRASDRASRNRCARRARRRRRGLGTVWVRTGTGTGTDMGTEATRRRGGRARGRRLAGA